MNAHSRPAGSKKPLWWWRKKSERLYFFCGSILGSYWDDKFQDMGLLHRYLCDFLDEGLRPSKRKQVVIFRGSYKTTVLLGYCVWMFCRAHDEKKPISIVYNTATRENAEAFMEDFRESLRDCLAIRTLYPTMPSSDDKFRRWTMKKVETRYAKFHVASLDTRQVSRHYTVVINDDLVNDKNSQSDELREKTINQWRLQKSILTRYVKKGIGTEIDCGTPYHSRDLIGHIRKLASYDTFLLPYAIEDGRGRVDPFKENGIITFPEMFDWEDFRMKREEQGAQIFSNQYELETLEETDVLCKPEWIKHWHTLPESYKRVMVIDPAGVEDKNSSATGITVCDVDPLGYLYILFADRYWITPKDLILKMDWLRAQFNPDEVYIEKEKYSVTIADTCEHLAPRLMFSFVEHKGASKEARIMRMKQFFNTGKILLGPNMTALEDMILSYQGQKDNVDLLDSLAYQISVLDPPRAGRRRADEGHVHDEFLADLEKAKSIFSPGKGKDYNASIF